MTKTINWKTSALKKYKESQAKAIKLNTSEDSRSSAIGLVQIGRAMVLQELLAEYGVDVDKEKNKRISRGTIFDDRPIKYKALEHTLNGYPLNE